MAAKSQSRTGEGGWRLQEEAVQKHTPGTYPPPSALNYAIELGTHQCVNTFLKSQPPEPITSQGLHLLAGVPTSRHELLGRPFLPKPWSSFIVILSSLLPCPVWTFPIVLGIIIVINTIILLVLRPVSIRTWTLWEQGPWCSCSLLIFRASGASLSPWCTLSPQLDVTSLSYHTAFSLFSICPRESHFDKGGGKDKQVTQRCAAGTNQTLHLPRCFSAY